MAEDTAKTGLDRTSISPDGDHEPQLAGLGMPGFDAAEAFERDGWRFFCSGEQLPDGTFHAVVRCRVPPDDALRTLRLGNERFASSSDALRQAREMARQWAASRRCE